MKKLLIIATIASLAIACKKKNITWTVQSRNMNEAVYASGAVMPQAYYFLKSNSTDLLLQLKVKEGDTVSKNQVLAVLGTPGQLTELDIRHSQVALAGSNAADGSATLNELKEKIAQAQQQYEQDAVNAARYTDLAKDKAVSEKDAEQKRLDAANSLRNYQSLQQRYLAQKNELTDKLLQSRQQFAASQQVREGKVLKSPVDGSVFKVYPKEGELVELNSPVLLVGLPGKFKLELLVDERDISKINIGQKVYFETDVYAGKQFTATINKIVPLLQKESRSFQVEAAVTDNHTFYPQSSVEANIIIRENVSALMIPSDFLLKGDSVYLQQGRELQKTGIVSGAKNGNWIEVKSGLHAGDIIAKKE
ncbi:efflux RND transporter periplasmic adaptor subunit [Chitinophaga sp. RAB17]|uniref:efflux RND transporter periplasmic adaptor subunit n=1 Tax=Chitinophaga sp. RAB17 TaxID=3233049 RepID=UPI003F92EAAA